MNDEPVASEIRFFSLTERIGRLRYLAYGVGLGLLTLVPLVLCYLVALAVPFVGGALAVLAYIALIVFSWGLMVRRLHDMDKSGLWSLLAFVPIANLVLLIMLLFVGGTVGENRFGPQPPPNTGWVIVGAVSYLFIPAMALAVAIPAYQDFQGRSQVIEATQLMQGGEAPVTDYRSRNQGWPADLQQVYPAAAASPAGRYVESVTGEGQGDRYVFMALMQEAGVSHSVAGKTFEVWTEDGGASWHCGSGGSDPVNPRYLLANCRDDGAP